ncbi:MAG: WD40 repeat domain-containing protein [Planctomycetaceae bacterium]|nr:WD40 repeat domain-containing protein [Planctomycetaceae bacterium]
MTDVVFAPNGCRLASQGSSWISSPNQRTVAVWDVDPQAPMPVLRGHTRPVGPVALSSDGRWIASGSTDTTAKLWDAVTGQPVAALTHPGPVVALAFHPDGKRLIAGNAEDDRLRIWEIATARIVREIQGPPGTMRLLLVSPDGKEVAVSTFLNSNDQFTIYDTGPGESLFSSTGRVLAYSPDGRWLATVATDEQNMLLRSARTREVVSQLKGHTASLTAAAFSPDSRQLATTGRDHTIRLWQVDNGTCRVLGGHSDTIYSLAFHPHESRLATGGDDGKIWLWNPESGKLVTKLPGHMGHINSLAFSPDGTTLVSGSGDTIVRLWDTKPQRERHLARRDL